MKTVVRSTQFKKDFKKISRQLDKVEALLSITRMLENEHPIPMEYKPHKLTGNYAGFMECHIENDLLLIWIDETTDTIKLVRLGTHHELFGL
jgi:mRNA interferase YafQ